jgi:hypothetical protein
MLYENLVVILDFCVIIFREEEIFYLDLRIVTPFDSVYYIKLNLHSNEYPNTKL